jgi:hypothetical protein
MKVQFRTKLDADECKKRISEDANTLMQDAKLMCDMESGDKEKYSLRQRIGWVGLKRALQAQMLVAKIGGGTMDWNNIIMLMKSFSDSPPFKFISFIDGVGVIEYDDNYIQYVGFARMKYDDKGAIEVALKTLKKVMESDDVVVIESVKASSLLVGGNENADK